VGPARRKAKAVAPRPPATTALSLFTVVPPPSSTVVRLSLKRPPDSRSVKVAHISTSEAELSEWGRLVASVPVGQAVEFVYRTPPGHFAGSASVPVWVYATDSGRWEAVPAGYVSPSVPVSSDFKVVRAG